ncbi:toll-like receptor 6 [Contarinia nasturtii]|uniref:toll-like receptor 6 n=1 Tax=Contarinia nasturtii TaxID=265458 RepID=UPI0012D3D656|nr:toll-like receptor 6 [Contarinia nasturtii]
MMETKIFYYFLFMCASSIDITLSAQKYGHISDCYFYDRSIITGNDNVTFICGNYPNENGVFVDQTKFRCSNYQRNVLNYYPGTIDFRSCRFPKLERNFFQQFPRMHTFIISNLGLEELDAKMFGEARNVSNLILSQNSLKEIPAFLLVNAKRLKYADFSNNSIERIDRLGFTDAYSLEVLDLSRNAISEIDRETFIDLTNLKSLNMSYNKIKKIDPQAFNMNNLLTLNLSNNEVIGLDENTFNQTINLKSLDLSNNFIGDLAVGIFSFMPNLEYLNLRRTNLSDIKFGTFSHQHKLILLDLSENNLKKLDFSLFMPIMHDLQSLELDENQLIDLDGFSNSLFPQLRTLDIKHNNFNCSHLIKLMKSVNWEKIRIPVESNSIKPDETSIRGVKCSGNLTELREDISVLNEKNSDNGGSSTFLEYSMIFMCVVMLTFFVLFLVLNKDRFIKFTNFRRLNGGISTTTLSATAKMLNVLVIVFAILANFSVHSLKYKHINDCKFYNTGQNYGDDNITFVCGEIDKSSHLFDSEKFKCQKMQNTVDNKWLGKINFENCQFHDMDFDFFRDFPSIHTLLASDLELEIMHVEFYRDAKNLTYLDVSQNRLSEIPQLLFFSAEHLTNADFSNNSIEQIDNLSFLGANNLKILNLSYNKIHHLKSNVLSAPKLEFLDLSNNNLSILERYSFDNLTKLKQLNLSFNPIGDFKIDMFVHLMKIENLDLKRTNISTIRLGTFSHQQKLIRLDLSENNLKELDFSHFLPLLPDLRSLFLDENQLTHLDGFANDLFPKLELLDIRNNSFNCDYLQQFMKSIKWEKLELPLDKSSTKPHEESIRGINCKVMENNNSPEQVESFREKLIETLEKVKQTVTSYTFLLNIYMILIFVTLLIFFIVYVIANLDQICKRQVTFQHQQNERPLVPESSVEFKNHSEVLIIKER